MAFSAARLGRLAGGLPRLLIGDQSAKVEQVIAAPVVQESGGYIFWLGYEGEIKRRKRERKKRKELEEQAEFIEDVLERALAREFRKQDAERERVAELERLKVLAEKHQEALRKEASERVIKAAECAIAQGNYSAMEALDRELRRLKEEQDFLMLAVRIAIDA